MNALLIYPEYPDSYFGFRHTLKFISKKASVPPIGLITISAMFPSGWKKKLVDMNVSPLTDTALEWADYVFVSAMTIQKESLRDVIEVCLKHDVVIVGGGPLFLHEYDKYPEINHIFIKEAEQIFPAFLKDLEYGNQVKRIYRADSYPKLDISPTPDFHLLDYGEYAYMNLELSRGCPFSCEFCEIPAIQGQKVRVKETEQFIKELEAIYNLNWRGWIFIVDDNFIGNKREVKENILPAMISWMQKHDYPFEIYVQASIDMADDEELMSMMLDAGITSAFLGIETPSKISLHESNKIQNENRDMLHSVSKLQSSGFHISGGFIIGFDSDTTSVFKQQIDFIQKSGIVWAVVGLLNAPPGTKLYKRLLAEGRIDREATGNNVDSTMNFIPIMDKEVLLSGYQEVIDNIYRIKPYYTRIRQFTKKYKPRRGRPARFKSFYITAFIKSMITMGIIERGRREYWKLLIWTLFNHPRLFKDVLIYIITGYHFRKIYGVTNSAYNNNI